MRGRRRRWSRTPSSSRARRGIRWGCCWDRRARGCRSWCRSGMGGCWCRRSRTTGGRRCRWRRICPGRRRRGCGSSCAGTLTCPTSGRSPRRNGAWSSTSTTSTRRFPGRSSGMSSGWRRAWPWPGGTTASPTKDRRAIVVAAAESYRESMRAFAGQSLMDVWYAHMDIEQTIGQFRSQIKAKRLKASEKMLAKAHSRDSIQALGKLTTVVDGHRQFVSRPADDRADRGALRRHGCRRAVRAAAPVPSKYGRPCSPTGGTCSGSSR